MAFSDPSTMYANQKKLYIEFEYVHATPYIGGDTKEQIGRVRFKAFLTEYSDKFASTWTPEKVYGRLDPIQTFQDTQRTISLGWKVPSAGLQEAKENIARASKLMRFLYPTYTHSGDATTITKPPLLRLKFVNLAKVGFSKGLLGVPSGFTFKPNMDEGWWDGDYIKGDMTNLLYPKTLDFSCDFSVIHETPLGWSEDGLWEVVDITPDTGDGAGSRDFDYEKNSFPFMSWKESVNDVFNLKTPAEETDDYEAEANASMPTQEEADIANPVPDASADIRAQEEAASNTAISDQKADEEAVTQEEADAQNPIPEPDYVSESNEESLLGT